jgi:glutathione synthase/RimK-type ligase-like ATP-grasp enzyme
MSVLVVSHPGDEHAHVVLQRLRAAGADAALFDIARYPVVDGLTLAYDCCGGYSATWVDAVSEGDGGDHQGPGRGDLDLRDVGSVWWRRPQMPVVSGDLLSRGHNAFAASEAHEALAGMWQTLDVAWVNEPTHDMIGHRKAYQLRVAQSVGLPIPRTTITSVPMAARRFVDALGYRNVCFKSFSATETHWRETRLLGADELAQLDKVRYAPVIFQEYIDAAFDIRITVVGSDIFAAAIHSQQTEYPVDFRMDITNASIEPLMLPSAVQSQLRELMRLLGLKYGAIDMRLDHDGRYVFLEVNPAGQWLFVEERTSQPISAALADYLSTLDRRSRERRQLPSRTGAAPITPVDPATPPLPPQETVL